MDPAENRFKNLHKKYWRKGEEGWKEIRKSGKINIPPLDDSDTFRVSDTASLYTYTYIDLGSDFKGFFDGMDSILVRDEYKTILEHLVKLSEEKGIGGAVLTGQPGIGKSLFLYYILISRILTGKTTVFENEMNNIYLFGDYFQRSKRIHEMAYPGAWALSDSNARLTQPSDGFIGAGSQFFTVQATSPQPHRWKTWQKYRNAEMVAMDWWSWEEIYTGAEIAKYQFNDDVLMHVFKDYSHSARRCYQLAAKPAQITKLESCIDVFITNPPPLPLIENSLLGQLYISDNAITNYSSDIIAIRPNEAHEPIIVIPTRYICDRICRGFKDRDAEKF